MNQASSRDSVAVSIGTYHQNHSEQARFFEFTKPLPLESEIDAADGSDADADGFLQNSSPIDDESCSIRLWMWFQAAGAVVHALFLICTLTALKNKDILELPIWQWALGALLVLFGRFTCHCIIEVTVLVSWYCNKLPLRLYMVLYVNRNVAGKCLWAALLYLFLRYLKLPAADAFQAHLHLLLDYLRFPADAFKPTRLGPHGVSLCYQHLTGAFIVYAIYKVQAVLCQSGISYYMACFKDRMTDVLFHLYMFDALLGPPLSVNRQERFAEERRHTGTSIKLRRMTRKRRLLRHAKDTLLLEEIQSLDESKFRVRNLLKILRQAHQVFRFVPNEQEHWRARMLKFLKGDEVDMAFPFMRERCRPRRVIGRSEFQEWTVETYRHRKSLVHTITDKRRMLSYLNFGAKALLWGIIGGGLLHIHGLMKSWSLWTSLASLATLLTLFKDTAKNFVDYIIYVFVTQPFDVGDCCVIDGVQMIVERMNIMTTEFLRYDNITSNYSNLLLSTKVIVNCSRSQTADMEEKIEFRIPVTSTVTVNELKQRIEKYLQGDQKYWKETCRILMEGIEENKKKMKLVVDHRMNYHHCPEMQYRRSKLILELTDIFHSLGIPDCTIPPDQVSHVGL